MIRWLEADFIGELIFAGWGGWVACTAECRIPLKCICIFIFFVVITQQLSKLNPTLSSASLDAGAAKQRDDCRGAEVHEAHVHTC